MVDPLDRGSGRISARKFRLILSLQVGDVLIPVMAGQDVCHTSPRFDLHEIPGMLESPEIMGSLFRRIVAPQDFILQNYRLIHEKEVWSSCRKR